MVAEIIINLSAKQLNKTYDYLIPDSILNEIKIGSRVIVPFGKTKQEEGFVLNVKNNSKYANKEIIKIEDNILTEENIELAKLMSRRYFCNISECVKLMLPPGNITKDFSKRVKDKTANFVYLKKEPAEIEFLIETNKIKTEKQIRVLKFLLQNEGITIPDLALITETSSSVIKTLENKGYIELVEEKIERNPFINKNIKRDKALELTLEQQNTYNKIKDSEYKEFLIYGITGSRKNRDLFTVNRKCNKKRKNCNCFSTRNFAYTTNGR